MLIFPRKKHFQTLLARLIRRQNSVLSERLFTCYWMHALYKIQSLDLSLSPTTKESSFHFHQKYSLAVLCSLVTLDESSAIHIQSVKCKFALREVRQ
jgi:hypothetical protein